MIIVSKVGNEVPEYKSIRVDRRTNLGNPFFMPNESKRDEVCDKFEEYMHKTIKDKSSLFYRDMAMIYKMVEGGVRVNLQCHCAPRRCHADSIKSFILKYIGD